MQFPDLAPPNWLRAIRAPLTCAALAGLALIGACKGPKESAVVTAEVVPVVEWVAVGADASGGSRAYVGMTAYKREPVLSFKVGGVVGEIRVDVGDRVKAGQVLASIKPAQLAAADQEAAASLDNARLNLQRTQTLFDKGFVSKARLDDANLAVERAEAAKKASNFDSRTSILTAPADGVILRRWVERDQVVAAGASILTLGETRSGIIVQVAVPANDILTVKNGAAARIRVGDLADAPLAGRVQRISPKGDNATGSFDVEIGLEGLKPSLLTAMRSGMVARAEFDRQASSDDASVSIPALALFDARADQGFVYVIDEGDIARKRAVKLSGLIDGRITILQGLAPGERVVSAGGAYIRDGQKVRLQEASANNPA